MQTYDKPIACSLCEEQTIIRHNAQPLNDGKCCTKCNNNLVIPARLFMFAKEKQIRAYVKEHGRAAGRKHFEEIRQASDNALEIVVIDRFFDLPKDLNDIQ